MNEESDEENDAPNEQQVFASYVLIGAIFMCGGLGYGFDRWTGSFPWGSMIGILTGTVIGLGQLIQSVRHG